ncbi:hypothetical protein [Streptomyces sp. PA03-2a]|uniref:hypothetical protein n=1 Tax=Streptomyces sp. PA03-2a TaxID=3028701 RepID=UPI0029BEBEAC|nr:hypothetical protein [Streptomyces sp. PA03-2a]MDX2732903.1 hypothetical protein [Streptomyces sp. PA03-2a]
MDSYTNPNQEFIEVLAHRHAGAHRQALTGELIAICAEMNHLLARTKGTMAPAVWADCGDELVRCLGLYRKAWTRFAAMVDDYLHGGDTAPSPSLGPATTQAFQAAVEGARAALDVLRGEALRLGCESWAH